MKPGQVGWIDLTVPDATTVRDFYTAVIGYNVTETNMGGYSDYTLMRTDNGEPVAGVCHARGVNAEIPPVWLLYFIVANLDESLRQVTGRGGKLRMPIRDMGGQGRFCVIEDPAGAVCALFEAPAAPTQPAS
jgi:predicted enzyme related to lactoylglutathione lyase